jgi:glycosyltransferase involved in cell wall biosynthesis
MKIWVVEIGEPLPIETKERPHRYGNFCRYLAANGHDVTWWASEFSHMPKKHFSDETKNIQVNGINLWLIKSFGYKKNVSISRIIHNKLFARSYFALASQQEKPDIIISPIPTIENAIVSLKLARYFKVPIVADIRDEWPDELINLFPKNLRWLSRMLMFGAIRKMKKFCRDVNGIMGVTQKQLEFGLRYAGRSQKESDFVFPLGYPDLKANSEGPTLNGKIKFDFKKYKSNVCFFGTLGRYFEFDSLIETAKRLPEVGFIIAGDGDNKEEIYNQLSGLDNVYLPGWLNSKEIQFVAQNCDFGLAPYVGSDSFSMPNKIFEYMSNGLIIVTTLKGELEDIFKKEGIGSTFKARDGESLFSALSEWLKDTNKLQARKMHAKEFFIKNYSHSVIFKRAEEYLKKIVLNSQISKK